MEFLLGTFYFNQPMEKVVHLPHPSIQKQNVVYRYRRTTGAQNKDLPLCRTEH
jgi:hypothetical protein